MHADFSRAFTRHLASTSGHLNLSRSSQVLLCRTQADSSHFNQSAEPPIRPSSIRTEDPACANHVDVLTVRSVFLRMSIVNILRGLPCRLESLRLKFTNEPSIFVDGDLAESIKVSASDRLGDLVPQFRARPRGRRGLVMTRSAARGSQRLRRSSAREIESLDLFRMSAPVRPGARYLMAHRPGPVTALCVSWLHSDPLQVFHLL